jgi:hypothetical protein
MATARARTRQRRAKIESRTRGEIEAELPLTRQIAHAICGSMYQVCACERALDKPGCEKLLGTAQHIVDRVRRHDAKLSKS